jgi:hypothetical protein
MNLIEEVDKKLYPYFFDSDDEEVNALISDIELDDDVIQEQNQLRLFLLSLFNHNADFCDSIMNNDVTKEFARTVYDKYYKTSCFNKLEKNYLKAYDKIISYPIIQQYMYDSDNFNNITSLTELLEYYDKFFFCKRTVVYPRASPNEYYEVFRLMQQFDQIKKKYEQEKLFHRRVVKKFKKVCNDIIDAKKMNFDKKIIHGEFVSSKPEIKVMNVLNNLVNEYDMIFIYKHRFGFCKFVLELEYDFFCVLIHDGRIILFVIEVDGEQHFKKNDFYDFEFIHTHDIVKQYYLNCLNIHLLRISDKVTNIDFMIRDFIYRLMTYDNYLMVNPIVPIREYFNCSDEVYGLGFFACYYLSMI